jgi:signal transduction histidine kinase
MAPIKFAANVLIVLLFTQPQKGLSQPTKFYTGFKERKEVALAELKKYPRPDTNRVNALIQVFITATFLKERKEVLPYRLEALAISRKLNYSKGLASCYLASGNFYKSDEKYASAFLYYDSALYILKQTTDNTLHELKAVAYERKGMIYQVQENYHPALDCYFESLKYAAGDENRESRLYIFITETYTYLNNLEKAMEYAKKNLTLVENKYTALENASIYFSFITICLDKNDWQTATIYLGKLEPFMPDAYQVQINFGYYLKKGHVSYLQQNYADAFSYYQLAHKYAVAGTHKMSVNTALRFLSVTALKLGNSEAAKTYALQNLELSEEMNAKTGRIEALVNLSRYYSNTGNNQKAVELVSAAMRLKDSVIAETNIKQINILGAIYESDKQQKKIYQLQNEKEAQATEVKQKSMLNKFFIASIIALLFFGYLGYNNIKKGQQIARQHEDLQRQKIIELEKDKQLLTVDAMLKGQEEERSRIAKDLHDGLGSSLSGTKLSFINVKESLALSPENNTLFERSLSMLDNAIGDLRKVAHNLMPGALVKFGLQDAVRDFCDAIQSSSGVKILFQPFGEKRKLSEPAEIFIFRIIQELVNNAIKHAGANQVIVQLSMSYDKTGITVEDDGRGFDKDGTLLTKGTGLTNINYRVQYFNGMLDIVTSPGNGTSINIVLMTKLLEER